MNIVNRILLFVLMVICGSQTSLALDWDKVCECLNAEKEFLVNPEQGQATLLSLTQGDIGYDLVLGRDISLNSSNFQKFNLDNLTFESWDADKKTWKNQGLVRSTRPRGASRGMNLTFAREGLYKISDNELGENAFYAMVVDDSLKSLRKYLMGTKKEVERNPDPQLYKSTILISKINNLLQKTTAKVTPKYIQDLCRVVQEFKGLEKGKCPELTSGLYKFRFKRFPGATVMEYVLRVPENYDPNIKSLFVYCTDPRGVDKGRKYNNFKKYITLWCHNVRYHDYFWEDFETIFKILRQKLNIDEKKTHIIGDCANGIIAMGTALQYPDCWAGCYITLGNSYRELAGNAYNMHMRFSNIVGRGADLNGWFTFASKCFEYNCCPEVDCSIVAIDTNDGCINKDIVRNNSPAYIQYRTDSLKRSKAYWISIDGREDENLYADVKAKVFGNLIYIETANVEAYSINLSMAPVKGTRLKIIETNTLPQSISNVNHEINIIRQFSCNLSTSTIESQAVDGLTTELTNNNLFKRYPTRYTGSKHLKSRQLSGGINDVFTNRYAVVCPSLQNKDNRLTQFAQRLAGEAPCYNTFESASSVYDTGNIVFVGTFEDFSALPPKIKNELPYKITEKTIVAAGKKYSGNLGVFSVFPNPIHPAKYLAIFICNSQMSAVEMSSAFIGLKGIPEIDLGVFSIPQKGEFEWLGAEKLDATWNYHGDYRDVLTNVEKANEWRWKAWRAEVIRTQIDADVGIFENCFNQPGRVPEGLLTRRDIHNYFQNTWIVKVAIKGNELKQILTTPLQVANERQVVPEISGVDFAKTKYSGKIYIGDIENEKIYTLACPQKCLNGSRIGISPKEYKITNEGFAIEFILNYLSCAADMDVNKELAKQKLKIF